MKVGTSDLQIWKNGWNVSTDAVTISGAGNDAAIKQNWNIELLPVKPAEEACAVDGGNNGLLGADCKLNGNNTLTSNIRYGNAFSTQNNYVIVIDTSGSTAEELNGFKAAANAYIDGMNGVPGSNNTFSLVSFSDSASRTDGSASDIKAAIDRLTSIGGTDFAPALNLAATYLESFTTPGVSRKYIM
jgi:hypothetical protein